MSRTVESLVLRTCKVSSYCCLSLYGWQRKTAVTANYNMFAYTVHTKINGSNCLLHKWAATAVCLWAAEFSSAIEYWHTVRRAKTNSSSYLLKKYVVTAVCLWAAEVSSAIEYWHTDHREMTNSSNYLLKKYVVTAVCLWAAELSSAIEYWYNVCRAKTNSSNCLLEYNRKLIKYSIN